MPAAAPKFEEIENTLNLMLSGRMTPTEIAVARIKRDLGVIKREDREQGFALEGVLETVLHNQDAALAAFRKAMQFSATGNNPAISYHYGLSLTMMGDSHSALDHLRIASASGPHPIALEAITLMARLGAVLEAEEFFIEQNSDSAMRFPFADTAAFMRGAEISDSTVISALEIPTKMVWDAGFMVCGANDYIIDDGWLRRLIVPDAVPENLLNQWEKRIDEILVEKNISLLTAGFSIGFIWINEVTLKEVA